METIIEEVRTSKDIKYTVSIWFVDTATEAIYLVRQSTLLSRLVLNLIALQIENKRTLSKVCK